MKYAFMERLFRPTQHHDSGARTQCIAQWILRSIGRINALFGKSIESHQVVNQPSTVASRSCRRSSDGHRAVIGAGGSREFPHISASGDFSRHRHDGDRAASLGFAASQWHEVDQPNKLLWGGARDRGKRAVAVEGSLLSRWVRIFSITTGSSMQAMILTAPPQARQVSMSMPNTRFRRCAHVIEARRSPGVGYRRFSDTAGRAM